MNELPSVDRLQRLPLRALVAYAARCARRVLPRYIPSGDDQAVGEASAAVRRAVEFTECFAAGDESRADCNPASGEEIEEQVIQAVLLASGDQQRDQVAALAANAAYAAVNAANMAAAAGQTEHAASRDELAEKVVAAVATAAEAAATADERVRSSAAADWDMLDLMCAGRFPEMGRPIDVSESGPLGELFREPPVASVKSGSATLAQVQRAETRLEQARRLLQQERTERQAERDEAEREQQRLRRLVEELRGETDPLRAEADRSRAEADRSRAEGDRLREQLAEVEGQLHAQRAEHAALQAALQAENDALRSELESLQAARDDERSRLHELLRQATAIIDGEAIACEM
jgi:hypothetical protein